MKVALLVLLVSVPAAAETFKETVPKADLDAIVKAIQDKLPKPDQAMVAKCQALVDDYNKNPAGNTEKLPASAACFRSAGSIGAAVQFWKLYEKEGKTPAKKKETVLGLARAFESAAMFDEAATYAEHYANDYPNEKDAKDLQLRALCIRRQLGDTAAAERDTKRIAKTTPKFDASTACDKLRPIAMPKP